MILKSVPKTHWTIKTRGVVPQGLSPCSRNSSDFLALIKTTFNFFLTVITVINRNLFCQDGGAK